MALTGRVGGGALTGRVGRGTDRQYREGEGAGALTGSIGREGH